MVIGMGGVGSVIGQKLHEYDCFERILLADVDPTFAEHLREKTRSSRFQICTVNAMDTAKLITLMRDHGIAVTLNACPWQANHSVLEACHRAGSHYLDMAADIYSPPGLKRPTKNSFEAEIEKFNQPFLKSDHRRHSLHGHGSRSGKRLCALGDGSARHRDEHSRPRR